MKMLKLTIIFFTLTLAFLAAGEVKAVTEFTSIIDPDNGPNTDYTSLSAWEQAVQADLTAATTRVFSYQSDTANGSMSDGITVEGQQSGATATLNHMTASTASAQILLTGISGTFQNGEQVYVQSTGASSTYIFLADSGDSAIAVATCRSTGGSADTSNVYIDGWTTSTSTYMKIWADPDDEYGRHLGKWSEHKYRLEVQGNSSSVIVIEINEVANVRIEGLQIMADASLSLGTNRAVVGIRVYVGSGEIYIADNLIRAYRAYVADYGRGILYMPNVFSGGSEMLYAYNNIIYDFYSTTTTDYIGIRKEHRDADNYYYNNTVINCNTGFSRSGDADDMVVKNSIIQDCDTAFSAVNSNSDYNISDDATTVGSNSKPNTTVRFENRVGDDFHLSPDDSVAIDAGTSTPRDPGSGSGMTFVDDIDGTARGAAFDIGADEVPVAFESIICENTGAGGDCPDLDYNNLGPWEETLESDITASTTRVFSGSITGSLNENNTVWLYDSGLTSTKAVGTVLGTTSDQILIDNIISSSSRPLIAEDGDIWRRDGSNYWTVTPAAGPGQSADDGLGASPRIEAKIDGTWLNPDTDIFRIIDWVVDQDNTIKIYTTDLARHNGKWDEFAYRLYNTEYDVLFYHAVLIDGIQMDNTTRFNSDALGSVIANSIFKSSTSTGYIVRIDGADDNPDYTYMYNNIVYGDGIVPDRCVYTAGMGQDTKFRFYNNTIYSCLEGLDAKYEEDNIEAVNNVIFNCGDDFVRAEYFALCDHNASDDGDGTNAISLGSSAAAWESAFVDYTNYDFHLKEDSILKDQGLDISANPTLAVSGFDHDIDGDTRNVDGQGWDIGADETPVKIYRSVGNTSASLSAGTSLTISSTTRTATFGSAQPDNIGVGDVIQYGGSGYYKLAFITGRASSTEYMVQSHTGGIPTATTSASFSVFRAHRELNDWETQTVNPSIDSSVQSQVEVSQDLVASGTIMMVPCYAADTVDDAPVEIGDWTTGEQNYIKVYTPYKSNEVGESQRHNGKWDESAFYLEYTTNSDNVSIIQLNNDFVRIIGLQIKVIANNDWSSGINTHNLNKGGIWLLSNIVWGSSGFDQYNNGRGIRIRGVSEGYESYIAKNIVYGFEGSNLCISGFESDNDNTVYVYNNTVVDCGIGYSTSWKDSIFINNVCMDSDTCFDGYTDPDMNTSNNISSDATAPGIDSITNATVQFVDEANNDFHLSPNDTVAIDAGTSSVTSYGLQVTSDIDGDYRRSWDIGADEASVEFVSTVEESGGDFSSLASWEQANQVDLAATTTAVFECSEVNGSMPVGSAVTGTSSGATANVTVMSTSSSQILLYNIDPSAGSGRQFSIGEKVYISGGSTASNYCILSNAGNPAIAVAKIDGTWSSPDTTAVTINGWTTAERNYIRIYTTEAARHNGKWSDSSYRLQAEKRYALLDVGTGEIYYTKIEGLQIYNTRSVSASGIYATPFGAVSNCIIKGNTSASSGSGLVGNYISNGEVYFYNNIIYDFPSVGIGNGGNDGGPYYIYNNSIKDCGYGMALGEWHEGNIVKNNIVQDCVTGYTYASDSGSMDGVLDSSGNNVSSDNTAPGSNSITNADVNFVDEENDDFRLMPEDNPAVDAGSDLSRDSSHPAVVRNDISSDITGNARPTNLEWDIGAFEAPGIWYRSIGRDTRDLSNGGTVDISSTTKTATFSSSQPDNVGVGDIIQYGGTGYYQAAVIAKRSSSTSYRVLAGDGSEPVATSSASFSIYRAHLTLDNWEEQTAGNVNSSINSNLLDQVLLPSMNLTASNSAAFAACYASTSPDNEATVIENWTTATSTYIKIFTPQNPSEVGVTQRHNGLWDDSKYRILVTDGSNAIEPRIDYSNISGLQILASSSVGGMAVRQAWGDGEGITKISHNIIRARKIEGNSSPAILWGSNTGTVYLWNNIFYDWINSGQTVYAINMTNGSDKYVYNNTIYNCDIALYDNGGSANIYVSNNAIFGCNDDFSGTFELLDYNASDDGDGTNAIDISPCAVESECWKSAFLDYENYDFRVRAANSVLHDTGTTITIVEDDIIGTVRPTDANYDIGAFEYTGIKPKFRFTPGTNATFRGYFEFK